MKRAWSVPLGLLALLLGEAALLPGLVRPAPGSLEELHALANRGGAPRALGPEQLAELLSSPDPVRRDFAMTWDLTRAGGSDLQRAHLEALEAGPDLVIGRFFLRYQVQSPDLASVRAYFAALERRRARD